MTAPNPEKEGIIKRFRKKVAGAIYQPPERVRNIWEDFHYEAGLIPVVNETSTEVRRQEVKQTIDRIKTKLVSPDRDEQREAVQETYALFFQSADPWFRGLNNRELAEKVSKFGKLFNRIGDCRAFLRDLVMCCMQLLSLSWQAIDVTNAPVIIIQSRPVVMPTMGEKIVTRGTQNPDEHKSAEEIE